MENESCYVTVTRLCAPPTKFYHVLYFFKVSVCTLYPLPIHCTEILIRNDTSCWISRTSGGSILRQLLVTCLPYVLGLFHWGVCRVSKLRAVSKGKGANLIGLYGKCMLCHVLCFTFVSVCTRTHCPFIVPKSSETIHHAEFQAVVEFWDSY